MTVSDYAKLWCVVPHVVREYIWEGRLPAKKCGALWVLPPGLEKPPDRRLRSGPLTPEEAEARARRLHERRARYYQRKKATGKCPQCRTRYPEPGRVYCPACSAAIAQSRKGDNAERCRMRRNRLRAQGLCTQCGRRPGDDGKCLCKACAAKRDEWRQVQRVKARLNREIEKRIIEAQNKQAKGAAPWT